MVYVFGSGSACVQYLARWVGTYDGVGGGYVVLIMSALIVITSKLKHCSTSPLARALELAYIAGRTL